jgi:hypothetical protein
MTTAARPTGVTILAILALIGGVFGIIGGLGLIAGGALIGGMIGGAAGVGFGGLAFVIGIVTLGIAIAELFFAYGAWALKPWGWSLGVIIALTSIVWAVIVAFLSGDLVNGLISGGISIIVAAIILYYLNTPEVKSAFGRA